MTATATHEEYKNETVRVHVMRKPACRVELDVYTTGDLVQKARRMAIKNVSKQVQVPGFRKGKAPEEMILKKYSGQVDKELQQHLADLSFVEARKLAQVPLLNNNASITFQMKKFDPQEAHLSFTFETEPKIPDVIPALFERKDVTRPEVAEKQIEEAIRQMMFYYAEWTPVEDRAIQDGDYILINLDTEENSEYQRVFDHVRFEVSKERMANWMKNLVQGAKMGDVLEGVSEPDDTATEEEKKEFNPKKVRLTIVKVEAATLPELNDDFAKKVGAPDIETMRKSITDLLNGKADEKVQSELREQVNDFLVEKYPFDLPQSLVETEKKHRLQQLMQNPKFKNNWDQISQDERKEQEANLEKESNQAVRLFYLSRKIVNDAKISITHKEIQDEAVATLRSFGARNIDKIPKEIYALALSKIMLAKAQDHILSFGK